MFKKLNFRFQFYLLVTAQFRLTKSERFRIQIGKIYSGWINLVWSSLKCICSLNKRLYEGWKYCNPIQIKIHRQIEVSTATTNGDMVIASGNGSIMIWSTFDINVEPDDVFSIGRYYLLDQVNCKMLFKENSLTVGNK